MPPITVNAQTKITMLNPDFITIINDQLKDTSLNGSGIVALNFRDSDYNAESCSGFHPVEIHVDSKGDILSITDFSYFGIEPFIELGIELDWNFEQETFRQLDSWHDLESGRGILGLFLANFSAYYRSGVYQVEVTTL
jgi:hypothetical protein